ncbi:hypothetical protein GCM10009836_24240 [Pseudonocardia ailaonensis]|uniref:SnoaL-like domain-containing protein n=1 Tax=Pseudonocardia ailaonensis TaxID=367279 RepID=A0ABN2MYN1_9PSEU
MSSVWSAHNSGAVTIPRTVTAQGNRVVVEWLDTSDHKGKHHEHPCFGVLELDGEKIAAWRVYCSHSVQRDHAGLKPPTR